MRSFHWRPPDDPIPQASFFVVELAKLLDVLLMLSAAPVLGEGDSGLKLRNLIIEVSRWVLGSWVFPTVDYRNPLLAGGE